MERSGPRCPWTREDCEIWKAITFRMGTRESYTRRNILHNGDRRDAHIMWTDTIVASALPPAGSTKQRVVTPAWRVKNRFRDMEGMEL